MSLSSVWRKIKPKSLYDSMSIVYSQVLIHLSIIYGECLVLPWLIDTYKVGFFKICLYQIIGAYIYINVIGRMWKICSTNTSTVGKILPTLLKEDWFYCTICEANSPPRSFHCQTCNKCILKRDHHCMFTGKCIGYFNYAYYLILLLNVWMGCVFALVMGFEFTWSVLGGFSLANLGYFVFPGICFVFGLLDLYRTFVAFIALLACIFGMLLTFLMFYHAKHVIYGIVTFERRHHIFIYDLGWRENLLSVFGHNWLQCLLWFGCEPRIPGDGIEYIKKTDYERPKDL